MIGALRHLFGYFVFLVVAFASLSCSVNFSSSISGVVYEKDGFTPFPDVYVYAYTDEKERDADYAGFRADMELAEESQSHARQNSDSSGNFMPKSGRNVMRALTGSDGSFTVNRIFWNSTHPRFGKDGDVCDIYLLFFSRMAGDLDSQDAALRNGLIREDKPFTIVSDSANQSAVKAQIARKSARFSSGISGYLRDTEAGGVVPGAVTVMNFGSDDDDNVVLGLYYIDASNLESGEWKSVFGDMGKSSGKAVTSSSAALDNGSFLVYHGIYSNIGEGAVFDLIYDDGGMDGYVWFCMKEEEKPEGGSIYTKAFKVMPAYSNSMVVNFRRNADMQAVMPEIPRSDDIGQ